MDLRTIEKRIIFILSITLILLFIQESVGAIELGGNLQVQSGLLYVADAELLANFQGEGELELYLPDTGNLDSRLVFHSKLEEKKQEMGIKYLYLRYQQQKGHITLGRQPVSWAYGAILNPLDYGFGVNDWAGETFTPQIDGVRSVHFIGNDVSFQMVVNFAGGLTLQSLDSLGYGGRLRFPIPGHDLSLNFSNQPLPMPISEDNLLRAGLTYRGDLGPIGIYGAAGYYLLHPTEKEDFVAQLGVDYSRQVGLQDEESLLYLQMEYIRFIKKKLAPILFLQFAKDNTIEMTDETPTDEAVDLYDMLVANISLIMDPFNQLGVAVITESKGKTLAISPYYQSDLGGGVEFRFTGDLLLASEGERKYGINVGLSYCF